MRPFALGHSHSSSLFDSRSANASTLSGSYSQPAALPYAVLGPLLMGYLAGRWRTRQRSQVVPSRMPWAGFVGMLLLTYGLVSLSLLPGNGPTGTSQTFARDDFINVALSEIEGSPLPNVVAEDVRESAPTGTSLELREETRKRNVVLISLESTRARSVTPYNPELATTTFLNALSKESLFAERAYAVIPRTTNALTASICGIEPPTRKETNSLGDNIPARCLPDLLRDQGYETAFFQSATEDFERRAELVKNMGYEAFYPLETMDRRGFEKANYFGYEDDIMLGPSREWLEKNGAAPSFPRGANCHEESPSER